ncbi:hypothetical protein ABT390_04155 [Streptomyces aurantiacus]|uniref:hypothetical protein n=1 Tax=Streptomyces aurantiacus TaxID=47760 RepID=UPI0033314B26
MPADAVAVHDVVVDQQGVVQQLDRLGDEAVQVRDELAQLQVARRGPVQRREGEAEEVPHDVVGVREVVLDGLGGGADVGAEQIPRHDAQRDVPDVRYDRRHVAVAVPLLPPAEHGRGLLGHGVGEGGDLRAVEPAA